MKLQVFMRMVVMLSLMISWSNFGYGETKNLTDYLEPAYDSLFFTKENSELPDNQVNVLLRTADGALWVGTGGGLVRYHQNKWQVYNQLTGGLPDNEIIALAAGSKGDIYIGTSIASRKSLRPPFVIGKASHSRVFRFSKDKAGEEIGETPDITSLYYASDGSLWIGTVDGLGRYLGEKIDLIPKNKLPSQNITALLEISNGKLAIGTSRGLVFYDWVQNQGEIYSTQNQKLPHDFVTSLAKTADGIWVGTRDGLCCYRDRQWQKPPRESLPFTDHEIQQLAAQGDTLWVKTKGGLARYHHGKWQAFTEKKDELPLAHPLNAMLPESTESLWVGTAGGGLSLFHPGLWGGVLQETMLKSMFPFYPHNIKSLIMTDEKALWVGTEQGMARFAEGRWKNLYTDNGKLPDSSVTTLKESSDGILWIGTEKGLLRYEKTKNGEGFTKIPADYVKAIVETEDGKLWVGTHEGLFFLHQGRLEPVREKHEDFEVSGITAIAAPRKGPLWVGSDGFNLLTFTGGKWQDLKVPAGITALAATPEGEVWAAVEDQGLAYYQGGKLVKRFHRDNSSLPHNYVKHLLVTKDGSLWAGTGAGLARLHKGEWQVYTKENRGLPDNRIEALAVAPGGALWVGTYAGVVYFRPPAPTAAEIIGPTEQDKLTQSLQTFAAQAFDPHHNTEPNKFRFRWQIKTAADEKPLIIESRRPFLNHTFAKGHYKATMEVRAIDRYGYPGPPTSRSYQVEIGEPTGWKARAEKLLKFSGLILGILYFLRMFLLYPLLILYPTRSWARTWVNSAWFTKYNMLRNSILNSTFGRRKLFQEYSQSTLESLKLPLPYIPQAVYRRDDPQAQPLELEDMDSIGNLFQNGRHVQVLGRSGTGKSVLLTYLYRLALENFLAQRSKSVDIPIFIDLRTHPLTEASLEDMIFLEFIGRSLELSKEVLGFLFQKGGFFIMVDSLNEVEVSILREKLQSFLNRHPQKKVLMASQIDLLERGDLEIFNIAEITETQARGYLTKVTEADLWDQLPMEARTLARNPQDLWVIGDLLKTLSQEDRPVEELPLNRADLYKYLLLRDRVSSRWGTESLEMRVIYALAFYMIFEGQRVLPEDQLTHVVAGLLQKRGVAEAAKIQEILRGIHSSKLFKFEKMRIIPGEMTEVTTFQHELIGKFLAARYVRSQIEDGSASERNLILTISEEPKWIDVMFFVLDELNPPSKLNQFLLELVHAGGTRRRKLVAYAWKIREEDMKPEIIKGYMELTQAADLQETPAAI